MKRNRARNATAAQLTWRTKTVRMSHACSTCLCARMALQRDRGGRHLARPQARQLRCPASTCLRTAISCLETSVTQHSKQHQLSMAVQSTTCPLRLLRIVQFEGRRGVRACSPSCQVPSASGARAISSVQQCGAFLSLRCRRTTSRPFQLCLLPLTSSTSSCQRPSGRRPPWCIKATPSNAYGRFICGK